MWADPAGDRQGPGPAATKRADPAGDRQGPSHTSDRPRRNHFSKLFRIVGFRHRDLRQDMDEARRERPVAEQPKAQVRQHDDGEEYRRATLSVARKILERAQREISRLRESFRRIPFPVVRMDRRTAKFSESEFRESVEALNDERLWGKFLEEQGLASNKRAVAAVNDLVEQVGTITKKQVSKDLQHSLKTLELSIKVLLSEIDALDARSVSDDRAERLKEAALKISWQVAAASAAISANSAVAGSELNCKLVLAGLSSSVSATVVGVLHDWRSQELQKNRVSDLALLYQVHSDLLRQIGVLTLFIRRPAEREPESEEGDEIVRLAQLWARFMIMYARQLVAGLGRPSGVDGYLRALSETWDLLNEVEDCVEQRNYSRLAKMKPDITHTHDRLRKYKSYVRALRDCRSHRVM
jgi:post-segregation antitoxin (ccd killing protein)